MELRFEQECPQCGAAVVLAEGARLLQCPHCNVGHCLHSEKEFRFFLPPRGGEEDLIWAPYFRFRGKVFFCRGRSIGCKVLDFSRCLSPLEGLPVSLGVRPQALRMRFLVPGLAGTFLKPAIDLAGFMQRAAGLTSLRGKGAVYHRAFIGETLSLIYLPLRIRGRDLLDAVSDQRLASLREPERLIEEQAAATPVHLPAFRAALCPQCGWNLEGASDSAVLACRNCETFWEPDRQGFRQIKSLLAADNGSSPLRLPFWQLESAAADPAGGEVEIFQRRTGLQGEQGRLTFWCPAFKVQPRSFLRLARRLTLAPPPTEPWGRKERVRDFPVTLPRTEAAQVLKVILADLARDREWLFPRLPRMRLPVKAASLVYLPFSETAGELVQSRLQLSLSKGALKFGRMI